MNSKTIAQILAEFEHALPCPARGGGCCRATMLTLRTPLHKGSGVLELSGLRDDCMFSFFPAHLRILEALGVLCLKGSLPLIVTSDVQNSEYHTGMRCGLRA